MAKNILSLFLLITSISLSFKHAWDTFHYKSNPQSIKMMSDLGIRPPVIPFFVFFAVAIGVLLTIPKTFFLGNILNAMSIVLIMSLALQAGNFRIALLEIPFLLCR
jgi:hypothetical protein